MNTLLYRSAYSPWARQVQVQHECVVVFIRHGLGRFRFSMRIVLLSSLAGLGIGAMSGRACRVELGWRDGYHSEC